MRRYQPMKDRYAIRRRLGLKLPHAMQIYYSARGATRGFWQWFQGAMQAASDLVEALQNNPDFMDSYRRWQQMTDGADPNQN